MQDYVLVLAATVTMSKSKSKSKSKSNKKQKTMPESKGTYHPARLQHLYLKTTQIKLTKHKGYHYNTQEKLFQKITAKMKN